MPDELNPTSAYIEFMAEGPPALLVPKPSESGILGHNSICAGALFIAIMKTRPGLMEELIEEFYDIKTEVTK